MLRFWEIPNFLGHFYGHSQLTQTRFCVGPDFAVSKVVVVSLTCWGHKVGSHHHTLEVRWLLYKYKYLWNVWDKDRDSNLQKGIFTYIYTQIGIEQNFYLIKKKLGSSILLDGNSVTRVFSSAKLRYNYKWCWPRLKRSN